MSGPVGYGNSTHKGAGTHKLADIISAALQKKNENKANGDDTESSQSDGISKGLPASGLKANLMPTDRRLASLRTPSSSSGQTLPSNPQDTDEEDDPQRQEGARGRGPGKHEPDVQRILGETPVDSPESEHPPSLPQIYRNGEPMVDENSHSAEQNMCDEAGRRPGMLPGLKDEEPPGPRNKIVLDPAVTHIHYHMKVDPMTGTPGPILTVTADGEDEIPSKEAVPLSKRDREYLDDPHTSDTGGEHEDSGTEGRWRSALDGGPSTPALRRPGAGRWASTRPSFRQSMSLHEGGDPRSSSLNVSRSIASASRDDERGSGLATPENAQKRWSMLRQRILPSRGATAQSKASAAATMVATVPVTTELLSGQLPALILKTWIDRDEEGRRAVPVLLGNLRFRVGDSVGLEAGKQTGREMFKIECEYGDGAVKWVIYRELSDFLSLHAHYKAANIGTRVSGRSNRRVQIPEFPLGSIPYLHRFGGKEGHEKERTDEKNEGGERADKNDSHHRAEFAQASRDALQQYLIDLIRAVLFRPESNRLCKFFELSAMTVTLAPRGGYQGKAGFLKIPSSTASRRSNQIGLSPRTWFANRSPKWFMVRDSYFVITDGPEATDIYDVFLIDGDFTIERPKRAYRTGLQLFSGKSAICGGATVSDLSDDEGRIPNNVDPENPLTHEMIVASGEGKGNRADELQNENERKTSQHTFYISNSQRRLKLIAKNARQMHQFIVSMERVAAQCIWAGKNRFDSFAPIRVNSSAMWHVDGRDYFWSLARALNVAKRTVYIHDWWISPEIYLKRPGFEHYRLDNLLERKAKQGVKIYIIIYNEVSDKTTPVDSLYAKRRLTDLHDNIMVQRSPSHFQTGTFYWSHHEKLCVIDETIAYMGGFDLCYGRWDTSQHVLTDEDHTEPSGVNGPIWRGKDYFNERKAEFADLDKPFEDRFDRSRVPRMPWHDVGLHILGHAARDLSRHFIQRWNLLIRTKNHKRKLPFLLPPADFTDREIADLKIEGTCEVQIVRSCGPWSMGTPTKIEHSIMNAYCKSIQLSEHFIYIENQFFITSTIVDTTVIENSIGDALVERIIRAHRGGESWRACIVIPLLPGYSYPLESNEASSVRMILECQNRTISRGTHSIFSRLRKEGIDPDDYITFFSLRAWDSFASGALATEQVYIHGKTMIVDDRLVLCGSANINERSQRGDRDSELVAIVRDTDMIDGTMAGRPFKVGRYAHTLRVRLMREHVGCDVDALQREELTMRKPVARADEVARWDPDHEQEGENEEHARGVTRVKKSMGRDRLIQQVKMGIGSVTKGVSENTISDVKKTADKLIHPVNAVVGGHLSKMTTGTDPSEREDWDSDGERTAGFASSAVPTLEEKTIMDRRPSERHANGKPLFDILDEGGGRENEPPQARLAEGEPARTDQHGKGKGEGNGEGEGKGDGWPAEEPNPPSGAPEKFGAPANPNEQRDNDEPRVHEPDAMGGTKDDNTSGSNDYEDDDVPSEGGNPELLRARSVLRKHLTAKVNASPWNMPTATPKIDANRFHDPLDERFWNDMWVAVAVHNTEIFRKVFRCIPDDLITTWRQYKAIVSHVEKFGRTAGTHERTAHGEENSNETAPTDTVTEESDLANNSRYRSNAPSPESDPGSPPLSDATAVAGATDTNESSAKAGTKAEGGAGGGGGSGGGVVGITNEKTPSGEDDAWHEWELREMRELLGETRGHLVVYPTRFLEGEDMANNFLFNSDRILPVAVFD